MDEAFDIWKKEKIRKFDYHLDWEEWHKREPLKTWYVRDRAIIRAYLSGALEMKLPRQWVVHTGVRESLARSTSVTSRIWDAQPRADHFRRATSFLLTHTLITAGQIWTSRGYPTTLTRPTWPSFRRSFHQSTVDLYRNDLSTKRRVEVTTCLRIRFDRWPAQVGRTIQGGKSRLFHVRAVR
jgi:hypothetical protein